MTIKHLFTIYTIVMLSVAIASAACKAYEISLVIYLVWYATLQGMICSDRDKAIADKLRKGDKTNGQKTTCCDCR